MTSELLAVLKEVGKGIVEKTGETFIDKGKQLGDKIKEITEDNMSELTNTRIESVLNPGDGVRIKLDDIKNLTPEQLRESMQRNLNDIDVNYEEIDDKKEGLTDEEKSKIKEDTGWSDEIIESIGSWEEFEIYKDAGLTEVDIGGKKCLIKSDIDWDQIDSMGRTNKERAEQGLSPINKDGGKIELHHIGQHADSPLAELTQEEHRGKGNDSILHDKTKESEIDRYAFSRERSEHWLARVEKESEEL